MEYLKNFDLDNLSNANLKRIFNKIWVVDTWDYLPRQEVGDQRRGLVFDYQFMKMSYFELVEKAIEMNYPKPLAVEIVRV